jgi:hypothetical protein
MGRAEHLGELAAGLDAQQWAVKFSILVAIVGASMMAAGVSIPLFSAGFAACLSLVGAMMMFRSWNGLRAGTSTTWPEAGGRIAIAIGSGSLALCSLPLSLRYAANVTPLMLAAFVLCGVCWFLGEVSKLHFVQRVASHVCDGYTSRQARSIRWGTYALVLLLAAPLLVRFPGSGLMTPALFLMLATCSLVVFSLLTAHLCGRASRVVEQQAICGELIELGQVLVPVSSSEWSEFQGRPSIMATLRSMVS